MTGRLTTSRRCFGSPRLLRLFLLHLLRRRAHRRKPDYSGAVDDLAARVESRSVRRTIPRFLGVVPSHDPVQVGAYRRALVNGAVLIAIYGDLSAAATDDGTFTRLDSRDVTEITGGEPVLVLLGGVRVLLHIVRS